MVRSEFSVSVAGVWAALLPLGCSPDPDFDVEAVVSCVECHLELDTDLVRLESSEVAPLQLPAFIVATDYGFATVGLDTDHVLFRYDSLGNHLATVDRQGQGPSEFMRIASLVPSDDGLIALDVGNQRRSVLGWNLNVIAETPLMFQPQWRGHAVTANGQEFVKTVARTAEGVSSGIAPLRADGSVGVLFQWPHEQVRGLGLMPVPATDSTIWVYSFDTGWIVEFGGGPSALRQIPPPPWFEVTDPGGDVREGDSFPVTMSLVSVAQSAPWLLALYSVRDPRWNEAVPIESRDRLAILDEMRDSILHVIDPDTGEVVAALRMDAYAEFVLPDMRIVQVGLSPRGDPRVTIRGIQLAVPES